MLASAVIGLLMGFLLGGRFRVMVLAPVILLTIILALLAALVHLQHALVIAETSGIAIIAVQMGYLCGIGFRHLVISGRASRLRSPSVSNLQTRRRPAL
jgi:hypothetical protein